MKRQLRSEWMSTAKWGLFMHFLSAPPSTSVAGVQNADEWNRKVDAFNTDKLAEQLAESGAGYFYITIGQCSGYYCSPNESYERITGTGKCSKRDLVNDLYESLSKYNIPLLVYLPSHAPSGDIQAFKALKCIPPWNYSQWSPPDMDSLKKYEEKDARISIFQRKWEAIIREWSMRWGRKIKGWWFDGGYYYETLYKNDNEPNFTSFAAAVRSGNPDSLFTLNSGVIYPPLTIDIEEDYTAGEINDVWRLPALGKYDKQALYHVLSFMGPYWGKGPSRFTAEEMTKYARKITDYGGAFTWDIPFNQDGTLDGHTLNILKDFSSKMKLESPSTPLKITPAPTIKLKLLKRPEKSQNGTLSEGCVQVFLDNRHDSQIQGKLQLKLDQSDDMKLDKSELAYSIAAWKSSQDTIKLIPDKNARTGSTYTLELQDSISGEISCCRFPLAGEILLADDGTKQISNSINIKGEKAADLAISISDKCFILKATVIDLNISRAPKPWEKSCVELFFETDKKQGIRQFFLLPEFANEKAALAAWGGKLKIIDSIPVCFEAGSNGYTVSVSIPLKMISSTETAQDQFKFEISVTRADSEGRFEKGTLFGSDQASVDSSFYMNIRIV